jgi:hypothetical protein
MYLDSDVSSATCTSHEMFSKCFTPASTLVASDSMRSSNHSASIANATEAPKSPQFVEVRRVDQGSEAHQNCISASVCDFAIAMGVCGAGDER